jgi:Xaa-Pro aminopeptidase
MRRFSFVVAALAAALAGVSAQPAGVSPSEYRARRAAVAKAVGADAVFVAFSPAPVRRTGDVDWPFRQEDNLLYLTGLNVPDTTLIMLPGEPGHQELLFTTDRDPSRERWTGRVLSREEVTAATDVREVFSARSLDAMIDALFQGAGFDQKGPASYFATPFAPAVTAAFKAGRTEVWLLLGDRGPRSSPTREQQFAQQLRVRYPELKVRNASPMMTAMREIKSPAELALIQRAVDITVAAQKAAMARVLTATRENEVEATVEFTFRNLGACCWAFPSIVASGRNSTTLHYESNNDPIPRGGLMLTDLGAEVDGYSADVSRTYPASGVFSPEQRAIYEVVLTAQNETFPLMRPGRRMVEVNDKAQTIVGRELLKLGLVTKNVREQSELYLFHGVGHPLGLQTHDVYDRTRVFEPNMVFTNEPGVYVRKDDVLASDVFGKLTAPEQQSVRHALDRYDGIGVRIEDDVLITTGEPKVLSASAPRTVAEIEALMAAAKRDVTRH